VGDQCVEFLGGVFVFVALALEAQSDAVWHVADALGPDVLVEVLLKAVVLGPHHQVGELLDLLDGAWCAVLETDFVNPLVKVDGALDGVHLVDGAAALLFAFLRHDGAALARISPN